MSKLMSEFDNMLSRPLVYLRYEWKLAAMVGVVLIILSSCLLNGFPEGLKPNIESPLKYYNDYLYHSWLAKRAYEGSFLENARSGYPFGSSFYDFPNSNIGDIFLMKFLYKYFGTYYGSLNSFYFLTYFLNFFVCYFIARAFGLSKSISLAASILFDFSPFHDIKIEQMFYTLYFHIPVYFYLGYSLFFTPQKLNVNATIVSVFFVTFFMSYFDFYYAAFGMIIIISSMFFSYLMTQKMSVIQAGSIMLVGSFAGVLYNLYPDLIHYLHYGRNPEMPIRFPEDAELYSLKLDQMFFPRIHHRLPIFSSFIQQYKMTAPLVTENEAASLGIIGSIGFIYAVILGLLSLSGKKIDPLHRFLSLQIIILFLFSTIGGVGALISYFIAPLLRAWSRLSIFISFASFAVIFSMINYYWNKIHSLNNKFYKISSCIFLALIIAVGIYDQTEPPCKACQNGINQIFSQDKQLVSEIENIMPSGSPIYQLPYYYYMEGISYDHMKPFLHSNSLRWSWGGLRGTPGDLFYRNLSNEDVAKQVEVVRRLGFKGIYLDKNHLKEKTLDIEKKLTEVLGREPIIKTKDNMIVFYKLDSSQEEPRFTSGDPREIMQVAGYYADNMGIRIPGNMPDGIVFKKDNIPSFVSTVRGMAECDDEGCFSDANYGKEVVLTFTGALPNKFNLKLNMLPFGPNSNSNVVIRVGKNNYKVRIQPGTNLIEQIIDSDGSNSIAIRPEFPTTPASLGISSDRRKLGLKFLKMEFLPANG